MSPHDDPVRLVGPEMRVEYQENFNVRGLRALPAAWGRPTR
jgi:hypothetical protein